MSSDIERLIAEIDFLRRQVEELQSQEMDTGAGATDEKVRVSANDSASGYLNGKAIAGTAITLTENNDGANETLTVAVNQGALDHGSIGGLADDDHAQYHNDARGDARYYTETELDAGQLDNRYFTETEHINVSAGAGDAGKPIKLDAGGQIDASMINDGDIDHDSLMGVSADDHHAQSHTQADHAGTGSAAELSDSAASAGTGTLPARVDHTHKKAVNVRKNSAGSVFTRPRLNLVEGANITLTVADDAVGDEVDVTIVAGAGAAIEIQEDDVQVVAAASIVNFEGGGGKVTDNGGGKVTVNITPGAGGGDDLLGWLGVMT